MAALDRYLPDFDVNEVHAVDSPIAPSDALKRILSLQAGSDSIVRVLFMLRGIRGGDLPLERFAREVLGFEVVEHTATSMVAVGRIRGMRMGIAFEAEPLPASGSRLTTETRVADVRLGFRLYWLVVGPFSALIRRRWLRAALARSSA